MSNGLQILVAEDDLPLAFAFQFSLEHAGFVVAVATTAEKATALDWHLPLIGYSLFP